MYCTRCGKEVREGVKFCTRCGAEVKQPLRPTPAPRPVERPVPAPRPQKQAAPQKRKPKILPWIAGVLGVCVLIAAAALFFFSEPSRPAAEPTASPSMSPSPVPKDTVNANAPSGNVYCVYDLDEVKTWEQAKTYCEKQGGHLATITSQEENDFLYSYLKDCGIRAAFFGLSDAKSEGNWEWVTGEKVTYTNWYPNEPNNDGGSENEAGFYFADESGRWFDGTLGTSNQIKAFICEWENSAAESPAPAAAHTDPVSYLGRPLSEVLRDFGENYGLFDAEGGVTLFYSDVWLSFGIAGTDVNRDAIVTLVESYGGNYPVYSGVTGSMTFTELREQMQKEGVTIPDPTFYHDELEGKDLYTVSFSDSANRYSFVVSWEQSPETTEPYRFFVRLK